MGLFDKFKGWFSSGKSSQSPYPSDRTSTNLKAQDEKIQQEESLVEKTKEFIANTADEVKEQGSYLWNEVKEKADELNEATKEFREKISDKAKDTIEKIDDFVDKTVEKARKLEEEERSKDENKDGFADKPIDFGKSAIETKKDFFTKAEQWLEKNEPANENSESETNDVKDSDNKVIHPLELPKE